ncbi:TPA: signal peptidase II, partial [Streptococcus agalactiae]|nr:signal peptidase II [Streptococcus agalactiae]HEO7240660.1 signal peptidase II [Streptococcus agalactiae]
PNIVSLTYLRNYGAAFSILQNQQWLFTLITIFVVCVAIIYLMKHINGSYWLLISLTLIISGGLGNFIDRLRLGYVVDMVHLDFINFAIFNVADSYLTIGIICLMIALWKEESNGNHN